MHADTYWKGGEEKSYRLFLSSKRLVRFVVLDVELCNDDEHGRHSDGDTDQYQGPRSGVAKYALADVEVARESDFGVTDETFQCVTHLGHLLQVGDVVLGYDITSTVLSSEAEWSMEHAFNSSFVMPDVVLVRKVKGTGGAAEPIEDTSSEVIGEKKGHKGKAKSSGSKKRERRMKKEEQKQQKLVAAAARMGLDTDKDVHLEEDDFEDGIGGPISEAARREKEKFEEQVKMDEDLADDLEIVERELAIGMKDLETKEDTSEGEDEGAGEG